MKLQGTTFGDTLGPAMEITDQAVADDYFEQLAAQHVSRDRKDAARIVRENLGYYAGYYNEETQVRVNRLFHTEHPIFGKNTRPSPTEALQAGMKLGKETRNHDPS